MQYLDFGQTSCASRTGKRLSVDLFVILAFVLGFAAIVPAAPSNAAPVSNSELGTTLKDRLKRVAEFRFIAAEAKKLGLRAWLFGGTAAGFAHYVNWDLQRERGERRFNKNLFDYDYTNIYRSTQDSDIVIDGTPEQAEVFEKIISEKYPHLQGFKTGWEIRLLRYDRDDKQRLLDNPNFAEQHSDSDSLGLIEMTDPPKGEPAVRDLRDWSSKNSEFLRGVAAGQIRYYFSKRHDGTVFFRDGRNPPILSVIRILTKAFQYGTSIRRSDLSRIKKIIDAFDPAGPELRNSYVRNWLLKKDYGRKLIKNAMDIESAWNLLEALGLREKLIAIENNPDEVDSLAWWMNREPLRSSPVGRGRGRTAAELGITIVTHNAKTFQVWESITRSPIGLVNALNSRGMGEYAGERAVFGDGFYTLAGREGDIGAFGVRMLAKPNAREGTDFATYDRLGKQIVVWKNKSALEIIPESLSLSVYQFLQVISDGKQFSESDLGILEKLTRSVHGRSADVGPDELNKILALVRRQAKKKTLNLTFFEQWFSLNIAKSHTEIWQILADRDNLTDRDAAALMRMLPEEWTGSVDVAWKLGGTKSPYAMLMNEDWIDQRPDQLMRLIRRTRDFDAMIVMHHLSRPTWSNHPEAFLLLLQLRAQVRRDGGSTGKPYHVDNDDKFIVDFALSKPEWYEKNPSVLRHFIGHNDNALNAVVEKILSQPGTEKHPEFIEDLYHTPNWEALKPLLNQTLKMEHWRTSPALRAACGGRSPNVAQLEKAFKAGLTFDCEPALRSSR